MLLTHLNVLSLWPNINDVRVFLNDNEVSCLFVSEAWLHDLIHNNLISIPGYNMYRQERQTLRANFPNWIKNGGGLAVYVRNDIYVDDSSLANLSVSNQDIKLQCLVLRPPSQKKYNLIDIYRPPSGNFQSFLDTVTTVPM